MRRVDLEVIMHRFSHFRQIDGKGKMQVGIIDKNHKT